MEGQHQLSLGLPPSHLGSTRPKRKFPGRSGLDRFQGLQQTARETLFLPARAHPRPVLVQSRLPSKRRFLPPAAGRSERLGLGETQLQLFRFIFFIFNFV